MTKSLSRPTPQESQLAAAADAEGRRWFVDPEVSNRLKDAAEELARSAVSDRLPRLLLFPEQSRLVAATKLRRWLLFARNTGHATNGGESPNEQEHLDHELPGRERVGMDF